MFLYWGMLGFGWGWCSVGYFVLWRLLFERVGRWRGLWVWEGRVMWGLEGYFGRIEYVGVGDDVGEEGGVDVRGLGYSVEG